MSGVNLKHKAYRKTGKGSINRESRDKSNDSNRANISSKTKGINDNKIISCFYVNARSIVNKLDELVLYLSHEKPDIVGITETWLHDDIFNSEISIEGYALYRKDRNSKVKTRGGGVMFYINTKFNVTVVEDFEDSNFPETLWCNIEFDKRKTLIGVCYRPPDSSNINDEALCNLLSKVGLCNKDVIIMGDFNFPELNWKEIELLNEFHPFVDCLRNIFFYQHVNESTRGNNVLDLVITSSEDIIKNLRIGEPFGSSDHQIVRFDVVKYKITTEEIRNKFNYFKGNYESIRDKIKEIDWDIIFEHLDVEQMWTILRDKLHKLRDEFIPLAKNKNTKKKWINRNVIKRRRAKEKAWKKYVKSGKDQTKYKDYIEKLHESTNANREAKIEFEKKLANNIKKDSKSFFAYVNNKQKCQDKIGPLINESGDLITDDLDTANLLNKYFSSVFTFDDNSVIPEPKNLFMSDLLKEGLLNVVISDEKIKLKLEKLKIDKSPGLDGIHPKLLYELKDFIIKPLGVIFRASIDRGEIPTDWKDASVTPLFKKGKKSDPLNYRPVSLTSIPCKILESLIKDEIMSHLEKFSLIRDSQHGFLAGRSCLTNLLEFMEDVTDILDRGNCVDIIYLDFAKAFDKVSHKHLFKKIEAHGISGNLGKWIENWLSGRRQKVSVNYKYSEWEYVVSGVPQGSVLGPLLFLIFINDLDDGILSKLKKFADDTKLYREISCRKDCNILQEDLDKLVSWSEEWKMLFNVDKCSVMHMGNAQEQYIYTMGYNSVKDITSEKDLGLLIDNNATFSNQCLSAVRNANRMLGLIRRNIVYKSKDVILRLYKSLVRPLLEYCVQVWNPYLRKDIDLLERVQRRATKMISEFKHLNYEQRLKKLRLTTLEKRRVRGDMIQVYKLITKVDKVNYSKFFTLSEGGRTRGHKFKLSKKRTRLNLRKNFFSQRVVNTWNRLPNRVVNASNVNAFKKELDEFDNYM